MSKNLVGAISFVVGAAIGSAITWKLVKSKYETIAQEEIDSVKNTFKRKANDLKNNDETQEEPEINVVKARAAAAQNKADVASYVRKVNECGYTNYSNATDNIEEEEEEEEEEETDDVTDYKYDEPSGESPYVITPDEFGLIDEYDRITLTFYEDGVLANDDDEIIYDVDETVGFNSLSHFGEYEDDCVYVRNKKRKSDYEIILDRRTYSDAINRPPHSF